MLRFWRATINSRNGLAFAVRSEQAIREELVALVLAVPLAWLIGKTTMRCVELVIESRTSMMMASTAMETSNSTRVKPAQGDSTRLLMGFQSFFETNAK